jgi:hypothetical protein
MATDPLKSSTSPPGGLNRVLEDVLDHLCQVRAELAGLLGHLSAELPVRVASEALIDISDGLARTAIDLQANAQIAEADFHHRLAQLNATPHWRRYNPEQLAFSIGELKR